MGVLLRLCQETCVASPAENVYFCDMRGETELTYHSIITLPLIHTRQGRSVANGPRNQPNSRLVALRETSYNGLGNQPKSRHSVWYLLCLFFLVEPASYITFCYLCSTCVMCYTKHMRDHCPD